MVRCALLLQAAEGPAKRLVLWGGRKDFYLNEVQPGHSSLLLHQQTPQTSAGRLMKLCKTDLAASQVTGGPSRPKCFIS